MNISKYLQEIKQKFEQGNATEHSYRGVLENYLNNLYKNNKKKILVTNEPKRQQCCAPDFILYKKLKKTLIPIGYIEAKDIGKNLDKLDSEEQLNKYKKLLDNLIFTDYLDFIFYKNGKKYERIQIGKLQKDKNNHHQIIFLNDNFDKLELLLDTFITNTGQNIKSPHDLALIMAKKAKLMSISFCKALTSPDEIGSDEFSIKQQLKDFDKVLIHDISKDKFADIYAQTIAYGLFTARFHDESLENFSREESYDLIPKNNPFLRQLFFYVARDMEDEIKWAVDELCEVFRNTNIKEMFANFNKNKQREDVLIHFYEDFLSAYDPKERKAKGVWYTPKPVVNFIIRAVDHVLKTHFNLKNGIACNDKIKIKKQINYPSDERTKTGKAIEEVEVHKVQLLDIATGTGSFSAEVIDKIYNDYYRGQEGMWQKYVDVDLLPRLHGFEILMASYAMCHLKIDLLLKQTGYKVQNSKNPPRLGVYLTNALEEADKHQGFSFLARYLSDEAKNASRIKRDTPVMVAFGNPPYSVSSQNKGKWIQELIKVYKKDLKERKINLDDDYIKFIGMSEHYINKTGYGVVAMITNNSFIDGITHRQMRKHLLETFDYIYIYDLHGNSKKQEKAPDGSKDDNVFDIMQGVCISIMVKNNQNKNKLADVLHFDSYGRRKEKYEKLSNGNLNNVDFIKLNYKKPYYFFVPKDFRFEGEYKEGFKLSELLSVNSVGIVTAKDKVLIAENNSILEINITDHFNEFDTKFIKNISYRPFDNKIIYYDFKKVARAREKIMKHMLAGDNYGLIFEKIVPAKKNNFSDIFIINIISDKHTIGSASYISPLYLYKDKKQDDLIIKTARTPNLNLEIIKEIESKLALKFISDHELPEAKNQNNFSPLDLLDYIYAILHSPNYRNKYQEFLKIDFPRVPYPSNQENFWQLVTLGVQIRQLHLMEGEIFDDIRNLITKYPIAGSNKIKTINAKSFIIDVNNPQIGKVYINDKQYFDNIPKIAWDFYIGSYQPAQK